MKNPLSKSQPASNHPYLTATALPRVLRKWRHEKQMKIRTASVKLGVSAAAWIHWETGARFPDGTDLFRLSIYTGISLHELICPHTASGAGVASLAAGTQVDH